MAFAMHINTERCTGCNNCVVACPVNALELYTVDPVIKDKIYLYEMERQLLLTSTKSSAPDAAYALRHVLTMLSDW